MALSLNPPLLADLKIDHGPRTLLGRFFLKATDSAARQGVTLSVGTFADLVEVNRRNSATWLPLDTTYRPDLSDIGDPTTICILGRDGNGDVVATQGLRLFDWTGTNLKSEAESLRLFYSDPGKDAAPGECCAVSAQSATSITGRVAYGGAIWYRPDYRGGRLSTILPRIGRAMAFTRWNVATVFALITESNVKAGFAARIGYPGVEWDFVRNNAPVFKPFTDKLRLGLATLSAIQSIDDVFGYLLEVEPEVYTGVQMRNT